MTENQTQQKRKKIFTIVLIVMAICAVAILIFGTSSYAKFRLVGTSPSKTLPTSTDTITFDFNKELVGTDTQPVDYISLEPSLPVLVDIEEKRITLKLAEQPEADTTLTIRLTNLTSVKGETLTLSKQFEVKYIPFSELSAKEQERQTEASIRPVDKHPLLSKLPHDEISYRIEYQETSEEFGLAESWEEEKGNFIVTIATFTLKEGVNPEVYANKNRELRQLAIDWIKEQGVDPEKHLEIAYTPDDSVLSGGVEFSGDGQAPTSSEDFYVNDGIESDELFTPTGPTDTNPDPVTEGGYPTELP